MQPDTVEHHNKIMNLYIINTERNDTLTFRGRMDLIRLIATVADAFL